MNILPISELNKALNTDSGKVVSEAEELYHGQLEAAVSDIAENCKEKPIILLSGPSGSAKTTTALRLKSLLRRNGFGAHVISMDNYFLPLNGLSGDELIKIDLEAPSRVDIPLLKEHLERFWECLPTQLPVFNFADQTRGEGELLCRQENEIIILEGIHVLNPSVTGDIKQHSQGIYVSVRTRLSNQNKLLHPSMIRLMRRLMRDRLFRGRKTEDIIRAFKSVQRGETLYIMPFKDNAAFSIDTFMSFEAAVYCNKLLPQLQEVNKDFELYGTVRELLDFMENIVPLPTSIVPDGSIVREFVGGSVFSY
ncbi:MAG: nucleoside kinase [Ruminiclostridium sp.]|jgi:uridine kinase|nr:nucleoside kinase [Ruminiclostridium sp.]